MQIGRMVFGGASQALGIIGLAWGAFAFAWQPIPTDLPGYGALAYVAAAALVTGGVGVMADRAVRASCILLVLVYALFAAPWSVRVIRFPEMFGTWGGLAEQLSLILAAILVLISCSTFSVAGARRVERGCIAVYGLCVIVFGFNHFFSLAQTAGMVPQWLPPDPVFWAAATGVFFCAASIAIIARRRALLAARLLACMMLVFEVLVWLPKLIEAPASHMVWAGNGTDIVLAAAALVVADATAWQRVTAAQATGLD